MATTKVGIPQRDYGIQRNILDSLPSWATASRPLDRHRLAVAMRTRLGMPRSSLEAWTFADPYLPRADILHFFNSIAFTGTPWICTFETMLPRWGNVVLRDWDIPDRLLQRAMGAMTSGSCKSLIALSESARNIASGRWLRRAKPADREVVESKLTVLRPPQRVIVDASERAYSDIPRFAFVGSEFYRKGGLIFLEAVNRLHDRGIRDWTATLVGRLDSYGDHATRSDASAERRARELIERLSPRVSHKRSIPKQDVTRLFGESDFAVLPSLQDSFGYGVLEAQACGAVAITTNIRAMPEMHIQDGGILVEMPLDPEGELHHDAEAMPRVIDDLVDRLEHTLETALSISTESRRSRALAQQRFLRSRYDPAIHRATLERIYRAALGLSP